ncbi:hypothetical protein F0562_006212 [Nyssa sinensis]|uniref:Rx N-terminal domain-containing protein n=1 Tax=Nyssa sinensis TaxID=561372 RepID=A0A5J5AK48_9ASTE|nr:hypothetical protein F0562_006212 [Nyssa sinensis]
MLRTRLLWFTFGFTSAAGSMSHFIFKDLWVDSYSLSSQLKEKFDALDARVFNLERVLDKTPNPHQDDGNLN